MHGLIAGVFIPYVGPALCGLTRFFISWGKGNGAWTAAKQAAAEWAALQAIQTFLAPIAAISIAAASIGAVAAIGGAATNALAPPASEALTAFREWEQRITAQVFNPTSDMLRIIGHLESSAGNA